ncbi:ABC transporter substrate-binding protein [Falsochrobactrum shanghaiense]|uniref:ABC transporter substrate-binding protein n=1 Tax=Falsochrobactrum shanghaiense TaxID=2201899 RepID=A0A316J3G6_9HYPH|nr:ABC transporter substrate-binding protein [Falsochrobactrum shanghaiense]PWL16447.1 ABC transporter substrate-binding protein [Falsochrobactrum shanghaiense]
MTGLKSWVAAIGFALAAFNAGAAVAETRELTLVVPNPSALNNFPLHVAVGEGYFSDEGLKVNIQAVNGSASVLQLLASGQADIGQPGPAPLLGARARGEDIVFIYNHFAKSVFGLVVPEDSAVQSPADLKGSVIGVGTADGAEVGFTRSIMNDLGLTEGTDYEFLAIGDGGTAAAALLNKEVAAYAAAVADSAIIEARGIPLREITPEPYFAYFGNGWAVKRNFLENNKDALNGFGRALVRATKFGMDPANREAVLRHNAAANPQEGEDATLSSALLDGIQSRVLPLDSNDLIGYLPPEAWVKWQDSLVDSGALDAPLKDLDAAYSNQFVETWNTAR